MKNSKVTLPGFTLPELVVSITFFSLVVLVLGGAFVATFRSQRQAFSFLQMQTNVRFALESMHRDMRTGTQFSLLAPDHIRYLDQSGNTVEYCLAGNAIRKVYGGPCSISSPAVTGRNVNVERLQFILMGQAPGDGAQPRITILLRVTSGQFSLDAQITVTQRELDS